ncbi:hypothetical protein OF83DRAFT_1081680 [Amylostereum chailletii]|nr:hypothetical protein OF83DRAFT_1081680 [Amylostereum chailletii]
MAITLDPFPAERSFRRTLPTELVHIIIGHVLADFFIDLVLVPEDLKHWDAGLVFLQVSRTLRACTIQYLTPLWGGAFPLGSESNYKKAFSLLRRYSELVKTSPQQLFKQPSPAFLDDDLLDTPQIHVISLLKTLLFNVALARSSADEPEADLDIPSELLEGLVDVAVDHKKIPPHLRRTLFGPLNAHIEDHVMPWTRVHLLRCLVDLRLDLFDSKDPRAAFFVVDSSEAITTPAECLDIAQRHMTALRAVATAFDVSDDAALRDIVSDDFYFSFDRWSKAMTLMDHVAACSSTQEVGCRLWKQAFATLMSKQDRARYLPDVKLPYESAEKA